MKNIDYISESAPYRDVLYSKLQGMKCRCNQPSCTEYKNYGGRGIKICEEWSDYKYGFLCFYTWSITHGYEEGLTIDRINVNGNYEPNNCRYISAEEQINNKRSTIWIWRDNKPIQLSLYCRANNIDKKEYTKLRRGIQKRKISPMTLEPYVEIKHIKNTLIDNREYLSDYCKENDLDYYTIAHIINIICPFAETIKRKELELYITYFYHEPKKRKKINTHTEVIQDIPIYIDKTIPLLEYCQQLQLNYKKAYNAIIAVYPYSKMINLSKTEIKNILL